MTEKKPHLTYAQAAVAIARVRTEIPADVAPAVKTAMAKQITADVLVQPTLPTTTGRTVGHYQDSVYG
jgi:hypothetical protein